MKYFPLKKRAFTIIGICVDVHNILGYRFLEIVYKDAIEYEVRKRQIDYCREREYVIRYKEIILPHKFYAVDREFWKK